MKIEKKIKIKINLNAGRILKQVVISRCFSVLFIYSFSSSHVFFGKLKIWFIKAINFENLLTLFSTIFFICYHLVAYSYKFSNAIPTNFNKNQICILYTNYANYNGSFFVVHQKISHHKRLVKFYVCSEPGSKT